jgi:hypothetical protein
VYPTPYHLLLKRALGHLQEIHTLIPRSDERGSVLGVAVQVAFESKLSNQEITLYRFKG